jgi:hypothetical protein
MQFFEAVAAAIPSSLTDCTSLCVSVGPFLCADLGRSSRASVGTGQVAASAGARVAALRLLCHP